MAIALHMHTTISLGQRGRWWTAPLTWQCRECRWGCLKTRIVRQAKIVGHREFQWKLKMILIAEVSFCSFFNFHASAMHSPRDWSQLPNGVLTSHYFIYIVFLQSTMHDRIVIWGFKIKWDLPGSWSLIIILPIHEVRRRLRYMSLPQQVRLSIFTALSSGRKKCNVRARELSLGAVTHSK